MIVDIPNRDGRKIYGIVDSPSSNGPLPSILIVHGFKGFSTQKHIQAVAKSLVDAGFLTLRVDLTGDPGKSYLPFYKMTYAQEFLDVWDVFNFFLKMPQVDKARVGVTGHSLGGMLAAQLASERKEVSSLVTLSAVYDFRFVAHHLFAKPYSEALKDFTKKGWSTVWSKSLNKKFKINESFWQDVVTRTAADFAKKITCPTLIVSSGNDESVSQSHADRYCKTIGSKVKEMKIIKGADHNYTSNKVLEQACALEALWFRGTLL